MLPPFIIEQIRQREEDERRRSANQPRLELPLDYPLPHRKSPHEGEEERDPERGVVILDLGLERARAARSACRACCGSPSSGRQA